MDRAWRAAVIACLAAGTVAAQGEPHPTAAGRAVAESDPAAALGFFKEALALDSLDYEANWRAAVAAAELGHESGDRRTRRSDSLDALAVRYARRAVRIDSTDGNGFFALAMALGRAAQRRQGREQLEHVEAIHAAALRALAFDPEHDGAHHVLGLWHAEVMRTSGVGRFMAKNILGAEVLGRASWDDALRHLERAVELDPTRIYHRLDLARAYVDRKRYGDAQAQLRTIGDLPDRVRSDTRYRAEAAALQRRLDARDHEEARS